MEKKKNTILIVTAAVLLIAISNAAYAYFAARVDFGDNLLISANFLEPTVAFTSVVSGDSNMTVYATDLLSASTTSVKDSTGTITVNLLSGVDGEQAKCVYDIVWEWTGDDMYTTSSAGTLPYTDDTGTYNFEYSVKGSRVTENDSSSTYENKDVVETDLSKFTWETSNGVTSAVIVDDAEIYNTSATISTSTTWTFNFNFYSLPVSQQDLLGKNLNGKLAIRNVIC